jgi:hypothetical protein
MRVLWRATVVAAAVVATALPLASAAAAKRPTLDLAYEYTAQRPMTTGMPFDLYSTGLAIETAEGSVSCDFAFENAFNGRLTQNNSKKDTVQLTEAGSPFTRGEEACESTLALGPTATVAFVGPNPMGTLTLSSSMKASWQAAGGASIQVAFSGGTRCAYGYKKLRGSFQFSGESFVEPITFAPTKLKRRSRGCPNASLTLAFQYATTESGWIVEGKLG